VIILLPAGCTQQTPKETYHAVKTDGINDTHAEPDLFQGTPLSVSQEVLPKGVVRITRKCQNGASHLGNA